MKDQGPRSPLCGHGARSASEPRLSERSPGAPPRVSCVETGTAAGNVASLLPGPETHGTAFPGALFRPLPRGAALPGQRCGIGPAPQSPSSVQPAAVGVPTGERPPRPHGPLQDVYPRLRAGPPPPARRPAIPCGGCRSDPPGNGTRNRAPPWLPPPGQCLHGAHRTARLREELLLAARQY